MGALDKKYVKSDLRNPDELGYTSRFVRVILAQGCSPRTAVRLIEIGRPRRKSQGVPLSIGSLTPEIHMVTTIGGDLHCGSR